MKKRFVIAPLLAGFFVMGFGDIIGTIMNQVKAECVENADTISWLMPIFAYVWFLIISIPTAILSGRVGRKNSVLISFGIMILAMVIAFCSFRVFGISFCLGHILRNRQIAQFELLKAEIAP